MHTRQQYKLKTWFTGSSQEMDQAYSIAPRCYARHVRVWHIFLPLWDHLERWRLWCTRLTCPWSLTFHRTARGPVDDYEDRWGLWRGGGKYDNVWLLQLQWWDAWRLVERLRALRGLRQSAPPHPRLWLAISSDHWPTSLSGCEWRRQSLGVSWWRLFDDVFWHIYRVLLWTTSPSSKTKTTLGVYCSFGCSCYTMLHSRQPTGLFLS